MTETLSPHVSIIVPVRNSGDVIAGCVNSLLSQTMLSLEVLVVGDTSDTSWAALADIADPRLRRIAVDIANRRGRDANLKRGIGLSAARGTVLALTDSDMRLPADWLERGLPMLAEYPMVASAMISVTEDFLGAYIDNNTIYSKTPRYARPYVLEAQNFGRHGLKPPLTANMIFRREVFTEVGGPDARFVRSYEDYEWARRIVSAGFSIYSTPVLAGFHQHRTEWSGLLWEYLKSGKGAADYVRTFPTCSLSRSRRREVALVALAITAVFVGLVFHPIATVLVCAGGALAVCLLSASQVKTVASATYPLVTLALGLAFWFGMVRGLTLDRMGPDSAPQVTGLSRLGAMITETEAA